MGDVKKLKGGDGDLKGNFLKYKKFFITHHLSARYVFEEISMDTNELS